MIKTYLSKYDKLDGTQTRCVSCCLKIKSLFRCSVFTILGHLDDGANCAEMGRAGADLLVTLIVPRLIDGIRAVFCHSSG